MLDKPWWEKGQHAPAFYRAAAQPEELEPVENDDQDTSKPKLGLHNGPKPPKMHREEVERLAREQAARERYLARYSEQEPLPIRDNTHKLGNAR